MAHLAASELTVRVGSQPWVVDYPPGATFGPRTLHDFELVWILHGSATWTCGDRREQLVPGSLLLARPGMTDEFRWDERVPTRHAYVHFDVVRAPERPDGWPLVRHLAPDDVLAALFRYLLWLRSAEPVDWERRVDDVLCLLLATFAGGPLPSGPNPAPLPPAVLAVVEFLRARWADGPTVAVPIAELAAAAAVSPSHLSRLFRTRFGVGPAAAVELLRLARAEDLLRRSNLTVGAVAVQCGFADVYHLSHRFRAVYGVSPRRFRSVGAAPPAERAGLLALQRRLWRWDGADAP